tara:strand:- start:58 stop:495 length:438 start_codon:yes stop_codon:yes gene_type:complete
MLNNLVAFILAFGFTTVLLVYAFKLPYLLTGKKEIVNEYYGKNFGTYVPLDLFFIALYLLVAEFIIRYFNINEIKSKLVIVAGVTSLITGYFYLYFTSKPKSKTFFSRWFHTAGPTSIVYDMILLSSNYYVYDYLLAFSHAAKLV